MNRLSAYKRFYNQKYRAQQRGIPFILSFQEWDSWWLSNGVDKNIKQSPISKNTLCMCRNGDTGAYELSNIYCATVSTNVKHQYQNLGGISNRNRTYKKGKPVMTPAGQFNSRKDAISYYKIDRTTMSRWLKKKPTEFYYL